MPNAKSPRPASPKKIATAKLSGKMTSEQFITKHRAVLNGYDFLQPILSAYDNETVFPTPAVQAIQSSLLSYLMEENSRGQLAKANQPAALPQIKAYSVLLYVKEQNKDGSSKIVQGTVEEVEGYLVRTEQGDLVVPRQDVEGRRVIKVIKKNKPAMWQADTYQEANRIADRRLFSREDSQYCIIRNNIGKPIDTRISRGDAVARSLPKKKHPFSRRTGVAAGKSLRWTGRAKQDHSSFSRG